MLTFLKAQGLLFIALAILAATSVLAVVGKPPIFTGTDAYGILMAALGAVGVLAGGVVGSSSTPNSALAPHVVFVLAAVAMCVALGIQNVFTSTQVDGVFLAFLGGSVAGVAGSVINGPTPIPEAPTTSVGRLVDAQVQTSHRNG